MCDDNQERGEPDALAKLMAQLHGPAVERDCERFVAHMRAVLPDFAAGVDESTLLTLFCAGRSNAIHSLQHHTERMYEASNAMTAMVLSEYSKAHGIDVGTLNANLERFQQQHEQQGATQ